MRRSAATVTEANQALVDEPSLVNTDPEGEGWFFQLTLSRSGELERPDGRGVPIIELLRQPVRRGRTLSPLQPTRLHRGGSERMVNTASRWSPADYAGQCRLRARARRAGARAARAAAGRADPRHRLRRRRADRADRRGGRAGDRPRRSPEMVEAARARGIDAFVADAAGAGPRARRVRPVRRRFLQRRPALDARSRRGRDAASSRC